MVGACDAGRNSEKVAAVIAEGRVILRTDIDRPDLQASRESFELRRVAYAT